ncbi:MAG: hypothetical protein QIT35_gp86 [Methanophagales virus PBV299]|uniref:Uncharacterized protein n=1 Tax=Methanophagales virus PBV299 TaxID=2987730 RepID=A0ABY6GLK1_9CAUD|nr:MAG: hypothetical protein QIT35_gp86 [Methanophagales virus PBV299]UYL64882.1 MAG: hypothetical protein OFDIEDLO_00086 [Methanophagales virus PBV299]
MFMTVRSVPFVERKFPHFLFIKILGGNIAYEVKENGIEDRGINI